MNLFPSSRLLCTISLCALVACGSDSESELIASAKQSLSKRDSRSAVIALKTALQKHPQSPESRFLLGQALLQSGDPATAVVELGKALELDHPDYLVLPLLVKAMALSGKAEAATNRYAGTEFTDKLATGELKSAIALAYGMQGKRDKMQDAIKQALAANPEQTDARTMAARYMAERGDFAAAKKAIDGVLAKDASVAGAWQLKGLMLRHVDGDTAGALAAQRKALAIDDTMVTAHAEILAMLFDAKDTKGMKVQTAALQKALPNNLNTYVFLAQAEYLEGNYKTARELVQQLLRAEKADTRVLMLASLIEYRSGSLALVETYLTRVLQQSVEHGKARLLLANTYMRMDQPGKVLTTLQPLLDVADANVEVLGLAAEAYLQSGELLKAENAFQRALRAKPDDPRLRTAMALSSIAKGHAQAGFVELEKVAEQDPSTYADLALISVHIRRNDAVAALKAVQRLERKLPNKPLPALIRGRIEMQRKNLVAARESLERALSLDPAYYPAAANLATLDIAESKLSSAQLRFEKMLKADAKNFRTLLALANLKRMAKEPREKITPLLVEAVRSNSGELEPRIALVEHYLAGGELKAAVNAGQDAAAAFPDNPQVLNALGRSQLASGELQQALSSFRKAATLLPSAPQPHLLMAQAYVAKNESAAALKSVKRALELSPGMLTAQLLQYQIVIANRDYPAALAMAKQVQQTRIRDGAGLLLEARVHMEQKNWDAAANALRASLQQKKSSEAAVKLHTVLIAAGRKNEADKLEQAWRTEFPRDMVFLFYLGDVAMSRQEWSQAEQHYRSTVEIQPEYAEALNNIAWLLAKQGKPGALPFAQRANDLRPGNPHLMDTLANAMASEGLVKEALDLERKAVAMSPQLLNLRLGLARIALKAGDKTLAKTELEGLAYLGDKFADQAEVANLLRTLQ